MKRTAQMMKGNVTDGRAAGIRKAKRKEKGLVMVSDHSLRFQADKSPPIAVRSMATVGGPTRRKMAKRTRAGAMNLPLMAAIAGPLRGAFYQLMAYAQQQTEAHEKKRQEQRKRGPQ